MTLVPSVAALVSERRSALTRRACRKTRRYTGESVEGEQATLRTKIVTKQGTVIPVDY